MSLVEREGIEAVRRDELRAHDRQGGVRAVFHPIVRLADGEVIGHEALTRPIGGVSFDSVEELFAFAESTDLLMEFERLCRAHRHRAPRPACRDLGLLFLNASARAVEDPDWAAGGMDETAGAERPRARTTWWSRSPSAWPSCATTSSRARCARSRSAATGWPWTTWAPATPRCSRWPPSSPTS